MSIIEFVLSSFGEKRLFSCEDAKQIGDGIPIPRIPKHIMISFLKLAIDAFARRKRSLVYLNGPFHIVGDLHGQFHDLLRVIINGRKTNIHNFLFLGDYIDRGEYSIETITFLIALAVKHPKKYVLLRGNHEFRCINIKYGFFDSIMAEYDDNYVWELFNRVFDYLPLAAAIDHSVFCIHAGISSKINLMSDIAKLTLPIVNFDNPIVEHLTWSDPSLATTEDGESNAERGYGVYYSRERVKTFIQHNGIDCIIKGHEKVSGVKKVFGDQLISVHTCDRFKNQAGYITYMDKKIKAKIFPSETFLSRKDAFFYEATSDEFPEKHPGSQRDHIKSEDDDLAEQVPQLPIIKSLGSIPKYNRHSIDLNTSKLKLDGVMLSPKRFNSPKNHTPLSRLGHPLIFTPVPNTSNKASRKAIDVA